jgi:hypothetical protein
MDEQEAKKLQGTISKISAQYESKMWLSSNGDTGRTVGGVFGFELNLSPGADAEEQMAALWAYLKACSVEALKPSMQAIQGAVKPKTTFAPPPAVAPRAAPEPQEATPEPKHAPEPVSAPAAQIPAGAYERVLDVAADDTVQYKVLDSGKKLLLFKVGPFKLHGIDCWPEVAGTWSEIGDWTAWQPSQPLFVQDFGIRQIVVAMKPSKNDPNKMTPDKVTAFR